MWTAKISLLAVNAFFVRKTRKSVKDRNFKDVETEMKRQFWIDMLIEITKSRALHFKIPREKKNEK